MDAAKGRAGSDYPIAGTPQADSEEAKKHG
jgi:hypothetical protein